MALGQGAGLSCGYLIRGRSLRALSWRGAGSHAEGRSRLHGSCCTSIAPGLGTLSRRRSLSRQTPTFVAAGAIAGSGGDLAVVKPVSVYLDSNILIALCDGRDDHVREFVDKTNSNSTHVYPFSAESISEITTPELSDQNERRLRYLERLSRCNYFVHSVADFGFRNESPHSVHATINEVVVELDENALFANLISHDQQRQARDLLGLDPNRLNNLNGVEAVAEINAALGGHAPPWDTGVPRSLSELMDRIRIHIGASFASRSKRLEATESLMMRSFEIVILFSMLDSFGYWPDDPKTYSKGSRFPDSRHVFNASYFDVLVSGDKRMRNRAEAAYNILRIPTRVLSVGEFCAT